MACCLATPAAASLKDFQPSVLEVFQPGSDLTRLGQGAGYQSGPATQLHAAGYLDSQGQALGGSQAAGSAATYWWYIQSGHYNVLMPGTSAGPYLNYYLYGLGLSPYLGSSYDTASSVLGCGNDGYGTIGLWLNYDPGNRASGWYYQGSHDNNVHLNLAMGSGYAFFGSVASHETTHLLFDHKTDLYNRDSLANNWYTEALAFYVGDSAYVYGDNLGYSYYSGQLRAASGNGAARHDWVGSGQRYEAGQSDSLDYVQVTSIGYFLAHSTQGWGAIQSTVRGLASGQDLDSALANAYGGLVSGMYDTASGAGVNTLYSRYLNYYLGHY